MGITKKVYQSRVAKWLDNLRSGLYEKCTGSLRQKENGKCKYCLLGVSVETYNENNPTTKVRPSSLDVSGFDLGQVQGQGFIPNKVAKWFGLTDEGQTLCVDKSDGNVGKDNKTFKEMAAHIERYPHLYFEWAKK